MNAEAEKAIDDLRELQDQVRGLGVTLADLTDSRRDVSWESGQYLSRQAFDHARQIGIAIDTLSTALNSGGQNGTKPVKP